MLDLGLRLRAVGIVVNVSGAARALLAVAVFVGACSQPLATPTSTPGVDPTAPPTVAVTTQPTTSAPPTSEPEATRGPTVPNPEILLDQGPIPITASLKLVSPPIDDEARETVQGGIHDYLLRLDWYRRHMNDDVPVTGRFAEAVKTGIDDSGTDGLERTFILASFEIERYLVKPWGIPALAEAKVTIVDRAQDGRAPDQVETGRLRMLGDRLAVVDGWDETNQRWFNGSIELMTEPKLRELAVQSLPFYLRVESWAPGTAKETGWGDDPFGIARQAYLKSLDRSAYASRTFSEVTAQIEKYETFAEIGHGLATVRLRGFVTTVDRAGKQERAPFERRIIVLIGNWSGEVVDEEVSSGTWMTGGDLTATLKERDRNFA